jgi:hypothetical protein
MSLDLPPRLSRCLLVVLSGLGTLSCFYVLVVSLITKSVPGLSLFERVQGRRWLAEAQPTQYWAAMLLLFVGALAFGRMAWSAYRQ